MSAFFAWHGRNFAFACSCSIVRLLRHEQGTAGRVVVPRECAVHDEFRAGRQRRTHR